MPHVGLRLAFVQAPRSVSALTTPGGRAFGFLLIAIGIGLLSMAMAPLLASGAAPPTCKADGHDTAKCQFVPANETGVPLASLRTVTIDQDNQIRAGGDIVRNQTALEQLGKALFWDQQVGSDGQSCGTCHFTAGADGRLKNQTSPGLKAEPQDITFTDAGFSGKLGPNHTLTVADFPLHKLTDSDNRQSRVIRDTNDVVSSSGVFFRNFSSIQENPGGLNAGRPPFDRRAFDNCTSAPDPLGFQINGINTRRAEPRNTPTMINAFVNNRLFWDSRAQNQFNGSSPFGARDVAARVFDTHVAGLATQLSIANAALASQADGPPTNQNEMSCNGRTFPDVGHKMLVAIQTPLAQQDVAANDSLLGGISNSRASGGRLNEGLTRSYRDMVQAAFQPRWWQSNQTVSVPGVSGRRPQIEANFSLFWGLSLKAYMDTLRADQSKIDRFFDTPFPQRLNVLNPDELAGLRLFESTFGTRPSLNDRVTRVAAPTLASGQAADLRCTACHGGAETTAASVDAVQNDARLERMAQLSGRCAIYDAGHFHTGVRPVADDPSLAGLDPFNNSFGETQLAINFGGGHGQSLDKYSSGAVAPFGLQPALNRTFNCDEANVRGTFKAPQLRNVELTGPYFHNGGQLTLRQVLDFYDRGGDFQDAREFDPNVHVLNLNGDEKSDLVAFLLALTDERVAFERQPFDHPGICFSVGHPGNEFGVRPGEPFPGAGANPTPRALDEFDCVRASGANGLNQRLSRFMGASPFSP